MGAQQEPVTDLPPPTHHGRGTVKYWSHTTSQDIEFLKGLIIPRGPEPLTPREQGIKFLHKRKKKNIVYSLKEDSFGQSPDEKKQPIFLKI